MVAKITSLAVSAVMILALWQGDGLARPAANDALARADTQPVQLAALGSTQPNAADQLDPHAAWEHHVNAGIEAYVEGDYAAAVIHGEAALDAADVFMPDDLRRAATIHNLAFFYTAAGRYEGAEALYKQSLAIYQRAHGQTHQDVATNLNNLAGLYRDEDRFAEAEQLYSQGLVIQKTVFGPNHSEVAVTLNNLAAVYTDQGKYLEAEPLFKEAVAILEKALGPSHPDLGTVFENYAALLRETGRNVEADKLAARALVIRDAYSSRDQQ